MRVVSNSSPILNLVIIDKLSLLKECFENVIIPQGVLQELRVEENLPGSKSIKHAIHDGWITVESVRNRHLFRVLRRELDLGEAEAIALAVETNADLILLDEKEGRTIAKDLELKVTGIIGVLLRLYKKKRSSLDETISELKTVAGFYIREDLVRNLLAKTDFLGD